MSQQHINFSITREANADLSSSQYLAMEFIAAGKCDIQTNQGGYTLGILQNKPVAGLAAQIVPVGGGTTKALIGDTVAEGDAVTPEATTGRLMTAASGDWVLGHLIESGGAVDGDIAEVLMDGGYYVA